MNRKTKQPLALDALEAKLEVRLKALQSSGHHARMASSAAARNATKILLSPEDNDAMLVPWKIVDGYAVTAVHVRGLGECYTSLHRLILGRMAGKWLPAEILADHLNGSRADNRRENLRQSTPRENQQNRHSTNSKSGFFGVMKKRNKWLCRITKRNGEKTVTLYRAMFATATEAASAYNIAAGKLGILTRNPV